MGEFSAEDPQKKESGGILPGDYYWTEGMSAWAEVGSWQPPMAATLE